MEQTMVNLNEKIDALTTQVEYLTEQARLAERGRGERAELMRDLIPIANDAFRLTTEQLQEIQDYVDLNDLLRLFKRVLRNGRNFEKMLDQLESALDLVETVGPLTDAAFGKTVDALETLERKGYFALARGGIQTADKIVAALNDDTQPLDTSLLALARQMNAPAVRRGLALMLRVLSIVGAKADDNGKIARN
ncbi:MAG: hypothetical protein L0Y55_15340 [Anaerolineales bacterium]|nr:hypothetical protein [Anaerolineales bacterium]